jgi:hypothetical protein
MIKSGCTLGRYADVVRRIDPLETMLNISHDLQEYLCIKLANCQNTSVKVTAPLQLVPSAVGPLLTLIHTHFPSRSFMSVLPG